jgi:hypothetical protein
MSAPCREPRHRTTRESYNCANEVHADGKTAAEAPGRNSPTVDFGRLRGTNSTLGAWGNGRATYPSLLSLSLASPGDRTRFSQSPSCWPTSPTDDPADWIADPIRSA